MRDVHRRGFIPCPPGLHQATYRRLLRQHARLLDELRKPPRRDLLPMAQKQRRTLLLNRLTRVERALGLPGHRPPVKRWYRIGEAAALIGIGPKTLLRWAERGRVSCKRSPFGHQQRFFARRELLRVIQRLRV